VTDVDVRATVPRLFHHAKLRFLAVAMYLPPVLPGWALKGTMSPDLDCLSSVNFFLASNITHYGQEATNYGRSQVRPGQ
jgi:hypothetical protein